MNFSKKDLISILQNTKTFKDPKIQLEQYSIDAGCAIDIIYYAGFEHNDINQSTLVIDLGAGTGRLSIASAFFMAAYILSVDIDLNALKTLKKNILNVEMNHIIYPLCADINHLEISRKLLPKNMKITTIMNPPFGVQSKFADRPFLEKAFSFSDVVYSIHLMNKKVQRFITNFVEKFNWKVDKILPFHMILENAFPFHTQKTKDINVDVYRFIKK